MAQGTIKSVTPQTFNGVHQVWQNKFTGKPNYGFYISFEDGTSGNFGSEENVYPLQVGTLDFISPITTPTYSLPFATIDLKLTKDRDVCEFFSNGLYHATPWGNMETADFTEAMMYRLIFGKPFVYLVFDYKSANAGFKDIPVITDINNPDPKKAVKAGIRMAGLYHTIRWVITTILQWESLGWLMTPIAKVCSACPILDCTKRHESNEV